MHGINDYLEWFGDIGLDEVPFNEVDALALAMLSYVSFEGIEGATVPLTMTEAHELVASAFPGGVDAAAGVLGPYLPVLVERMAAGRRFGTAVIDHFEVSDVARDNKQFCALTVHLADKSHYLSYRGTDGTIAGWREDFELTYQTVAAQGDGLDYLTRVAAHTPGVLRLGGHSKGGNLAAYAAALAPDEVRERVAELWCFDSPGFDDQVMSFDRLRAMSDRTRFVVPEGSIIGMILGHAASPEVVTSDARGIMQHNAFTWGVRGRTYEAAEGLSQSSKRFNELFDKVMREHDLDGRREVIANAFGVLEASGVTDFADIATSGRTGYAAMGRAYTQLDPDVRASIMDTLMALVGGAFGIAWDGVMASLPGPFGEGSDEDAAPSAGAGDAAQALPDGV